MALAPRKHRRRRRSSISLGPCRLWFDHSPSVLIPRLDLRFAEAERVSHVPAVRHAQVLLAAKLALQVGELRMRERGAPAPRLAGRAAAGWLAIWRKN